MKKSRQGERIRQDLLDINQAFGPPDIFVR
jgi:hypothetical protein